MDPTAYATRAEVYRYGLDPQAYAPRPRAIEAVDPATGTLTLTLNGFSAGSLFRLVTEGQAIYGKPAAALPQGLSASLMYEAEPVGGSSDLFKLHPVGGSTIASFGDAGAPVFSVIVDPGPIIDALVVDESRRVNECLTAQAPPIKPDPITGRYDQILVGIVARRVSIAAARNLGLANPLYRDSLQGFIDGQKFDDDRLDEWIKGRPIKLEPPDQASIPYDAARARSGPWTGGPYTRWTRGTL